MTMPRISRRSTATMRFIRTLERRPKPSSLPLRRTIGRCRLGGHHFPVSAPRAARKGEQIFVIGPAAIVNGRPYRGGNLQGIYDRVFGANRLWRYLLRTTSA